MYDKGLYVDWENIDSSWKSLPLITGTGGDMEEEVKAIKIDETYFKTSSPKEENSLSDFKSNKSFTESLYSLHKRKRRELDVERDDEWFKKTINEYTSLLEEFSLEESEGIVVKKKRRW